MARNFSNSPNEYKKLRCYSSDDDPFYIRHDTFIKSSESDAAENIFDKAQDKQSTNFLDGDERKQKQTEADDIRKKDEQGSKRKHKEYHIEEVIGDDYKVIEEQLLNDLEKEKLQFKHYKIDENKTDEYDKEDDKNKMINPLITSRNENHPYDSENKNYGKYEAECVKKEGIRKVNDIFMFISKADEEQQISKDTQDHWKTKETESDNVIILEKHLLTFPKKEKEPCQRDLINIENNQEEDEVQLDHFVNIEPTPQGKQDKTGKVKESKNELHRYKKSLITEDKMELSDKQ